MRVGIIALMHESNTFLAADRDRVLAAAARLPAGNVRDLFEGYLPTDGKGRRLGANARPASVLAHAGDAKRGEALFWTESMRCGACHTVGRSRTRADLLESRLVPSRRVEPPYAAYPVRTTDGRAVTGLLVRRDATRVVVRDAQNTDHAFAAADVEQVRPSRASLMPDGLLAPLTPREAADLLEYLATRK